MRTKNTQAYVLAKLPELAAEAVHATPVLVLDPKGALIADTNRARLDAKLELLQSVNSEFADVLVQPVILKQLTS